MADRRSWLWVAAGAALLAAFIWAGYYFFILALTPTTRSAALFTYPFLFGGLTYTGWAIRSGHGRIWLSLWASPMAWARVALIVTMQLSVLASTYLAGPVETSLLTLVGDVVMTPALLLLLFGEGRAQVRSPSFLAGISLSTLGASLTIIGGTALHALPLVALPLAVIVPASVALYFLASARANRRLPSSAVVGQATLGGGLIGVGLSPLFPGGFAGLAIPSVEALLLLVALGVTSFYIGPVLYFWAIERAGMILPALLMSTIPVFTLLLAVLIDRSLPAWLATAGVPIAVLGAILALRGEHLPWTTQYGSGDEIRAEVGSPPT
jgi:drug/metabolite transporter (DMT)-like permease